ncbi:hypothetical protein N9903_01780 [bacterium]|nr:hypothetical protein [bacterium]
MKKMIADKDHIIIFEGGAPEDHEPVTMPFITLSETEDAPPWPIIYLGKVTGYYVPKGWEKPLKSV